LWKWGSKGRKIAWVAWDKVCKSREEEGLNIINVRQFNLALLRKWIWRLKMETGGCGGRSWNQSMEDGDD